MTKHLGVFSVHSVCILLVFNFVYILFVYLSVRPSVCLFLYVVVRSFPYYLKC